MSSAPDPQEKARQQEQLIQNILRVLRVQSMDGFTLMNKTGTKEQGLAKAAEFLMNQRLIEISGGTHAKEIGWARFWIPSDRMGSVDSFMASFAQGQRFRAD